MNQSCETPSGAAISHQDQTAPTAQWSAVLAMSLCAFAMVASEFLPVSLLTLMAEDLHVSEGAIGQGISISGFFALITALTISSLAGNLDRRMLLLGLTGLMVVSALTVGFAHSYSVYMTGRILVGVALGGFWSLSAAAAVRLVPADQVAKALAIFNAGNALAMVIAAPLGSYLGSLIGWRGAFLFLVPVTLLAFAWQWISLPSMEGNQTQKKLADIFGHLKQLKILLGFIAASLFFAGQFSLFTYIRPYLETAAGIDAQTLSSILLLMGVAGFIGTTIINRFLKAGLYLTLSFMPAVLAAIAVLLIEFGGSLTTVIVLLGFWGFIATAAPVGWWAWVAEAMNHDPEAGGGLMVAFVQLAIGLGSTVGGIMFDHYGYELAFGVSALLLLATSLAVWGLRWVSGSRVNPL
ncbi:MFS transporter [Marinobacter salinexigens]|uniref:MFS transporter n=1 Tax=Marinobacter salinexigens TaxID=2919747 RepID=A0A5B0VHT8_9GAMM|nr:MFS transporter [Marinobacter salinexigens]KAA1173984.1 MFS transporter [Marinobacter salinexigens]